MRGSNHTARSAGGQVHLRAKSRWMAAGLVLLGCVVALWSWRSGMVQRLVNGPASNSEPTPACTPLSDVTPAACAMPNVTGVTTPDLALPEGGATPTPGPTVAVMVPLTASGQPPADEPEGVIAGPYLGNVTRTSAHVSWVTRGGGDAVVWFWQQGQAAREARSVTRSTPAGIWHEALLTDLKPGEVCTYTLAADGRPEHAFVTAPDDERPFTFLVMGDSRPGDRTGAEPSEMARQVARQVATREFVFALHTGDIVAEGGRCEGELNGWEQYRRAYLALYGATLARAPFYQSPGNHELMWGTCGMEIYKGVLALPDSTPGQGQESYYSFDWGNLHVISLNTNEPAGPGSAQLAWLEQDLASNQRQWTVVQFHEPVYSSGDHEPNLAAREAWVPLFEQYGVDLVFSGHNHIYERTCPIKAGACTTLADGGVVYVVTAGAGPALHDASGGWFSTVHLSIHHFVTVRIDGNTLELSAWNWQGQLFDSYTMTK